jgi:hypothetical protein
MKLNSYALEIDGTISIILDNNHLKQSIHNEKHNSVWTDKEVYII